MLVFDKISLLKDYLYNFSSNSIGFVPTMGALHEGHLHLVAKAKEECDITVVSIFVNPLQFNNSTDFEKYPSTLENDKKLLEKTGCDVLFAPSPKEMYPIKPVIRFDFGDLETVMEGKFRPGHFNGVGVVVSKLLNIVSPNVAFFGQKDLQQCAVVNTLIRDLSFDVTMEIVPTVREASGLAMSSRNMRLSENGKNEASLIYKGLSLGKELLASGSSINEVVQIIKNTITSKGNIEIEYVEIADFNTLRPAVGNEKKLAICFAGFLESVRLIDNVIVDLETNNG